jgi:hypothetical protein
MMSVHKSVTSTSFPELMFAGCEMQMLAYFLFDNQGRLARAKRSQKYCSVIATAFAVHLDFLMSVHLTRNDHCNNKNGP